MTIIKASFWKRLLAFIIDNILCSLLGVLAGLVFGLSSLAEYWVYILIFYSYNVFMDFQHHATLGKMILRLKVIRVDGSAPHLGNSIYRNLGKVISSLPLFYGFLRILAPHQNQTIHDELAKCFVIDKSS